MFCAPHIDDSVFKLKTVGQVLISLPSLLAKISSEQFSCLRLPYALQFFWGVYSDRHRIHTSRELMIMINVSQSGDDAVLGKQTNQNPTTISLNFLGNCGLRSFTILSLLAVLCHWVSKTDLISGSQQRRTFDTPVTVFGEVLILKFNLRNSC